MDRRAFLAGVGVTPLGVAGCLDRTAETNEDENAGSDGEGATENETVPDEDETGSDEDESDGPKETIEAFADGFANDDLEAVRAHVDPASALMDEFDRETVEALALEPVELDILEEADDEAVVDAVWSVVEADGTEHEERSNVTLQRDEDAWMITELDGQNEGGREAQAGVDVSVDSDAETATVVLTSIGNADGVLLVRDGDQGVCDDPLDAAGDSCTVEGAGEYVAVAYIGESPNEAEVKTTVHSFEIGE